MCVNINSMAKHIGPHVSAGGGLFNAPLNAASVGATAFALFTKNQRQWTSPELKADEIKQFRGRCADMGFTSEWILPHDSYLINLGSPDEDGLQKSRASFLYEMRRCEQLGLSMLNFHPGSHLNRISINECLGLIAESINIVLENTSGVSAIIENTAGQGSNVGFEFWHLSYIIDHVKDKSRVGICIDTCHTYTSGYNLKNDYEGVWKEFDDIVGLNYLRAIHLNDSKKEVASRVDRHESIGKGLLGDDFFIKIMRDCRFDDIPIILETPDESLWAQEISWLHSLEQ